MHSSKAIAISEPNAACVRIEISGDRNTTTFFPVPVDLLKPFIDKITLSKGAD